MLGPLEYSFGASFRLSLCLAVALAAVFLVLSRRHHRSFSVTFGDWFLASAIASVVAFTQYAPYDGRGRVVDLRPLDTIWHALEGRGENLVLANLLLFVPVGMALALHRWGRGSTLLASAALSIAAEVTQYVTGNGRVAQIDDVIINTFGAFLGWTVVGGLRSLTGRPAALVEQRGVASEVESRARDEADDHGYRQRRR